MLRESGRKEYAAVTGLLQDLRKAAGLRQIDLAERLHVPQSFISKYESGERRLDIIEIHSVCKVLGISLPDFARRLERKLRAREL